MSVPRTLRCAGSLAALAAVLSAASALAFHTPVTIVTGGSGESATVTDLSSRGSEVAVTTDWNGPGGRFVMLAQSSNDGASWSHQTWSGLDFGGARDSQVTVCHGYDVMIYRAASSDAIPVWSIETLASPTGSGATAIQQLPGTEDARWPDVACIANDRLVTAWLKPQGSGYHVRVRTRQPVGPTTSPQSFDLGSGSYQRGLSITVTANRVYVTWFRGNALKLARFSISSDHRLHLIGTKTIATLTNAVYPRVGADGDRVIVAYTDDYALKVRRSSNTGASFGSAKTLLSVGTSGFAGVFPVTVTVRGSKVVIGGMLSAELDGKGLGYRSTDGGSSYQLLSRRSSGRIVAGLVKVGSSYRYAEAWDQSISQPDPQTVRFRRQ